MKIRLLSLVLISFLAGLIASAAPVTVTLNPLKPDASVSKDFLGLSYETAQLLPKEKGRHYFDPENKALIALFRTLGVKSLRVGGNSVDTLDANAVSDADLHSLFRFARAVGAKVIYSVRLKDGDAQAAARIAKLIGDHYSDTLECFAIGNEPDYYKAYEVYSPKWTQMRDAILAVAPQSKFSGPDQNPKPELYKKVVEDFGKTGRLAMLNGHNYPAGCAYKNPGKIKTIQDLILIDATEARAKLLSPEMYGVYEEVRKALVGAVEGTSIPFRLSETNSYWYGGLKDASDSPTAALWALDYLYWWASHGAKGLNFHTGDRVGGGDKIIPCRYSAFVSTEGGYDVYPLAYGMKLFDLGSHGRLVPVLVSPADVRNVSVYATVDEKGTVSVTLINKAQGEGAAEAEIQLSFETPSKVAGAKIIYLTAPAGDGSAKAGTTLGGTRILEDGTWKGKWAPLAIAGTGNTVTVKVASSSAALVQLHLP